MGKRSRPGNKIYCQLIAQSLTKGIQSNYGFACPWATTDKYDMFLGSLCRFAYCLENSIISSQLLI